MLQNLLDSFKNFFSSIFGSSSTPRPIPTNQSTDTDIPDAMEDASDVPQDTTVVIPVTQVEGFEPVEPNTGGDESIEAPPEIEPADPTGGDGTTSGEPTSDDSTTTTEDPTPPLPPQHQPQFLWCLDNGHGKKQAGKRSPKFILNGKETQLLEYEFNRDIVLRIMKALDEKGVRYFDVVPDVEDVGKFLSGRVKRANDAARNSDLPAIYVSIHANAFGDGNWTSPSGIETWYQSRSGKRIAAFFHKHIVAQTKWVDRGLKTNPSSPFFVLKNTSMPAVLTENGFYTNERETKELLKDSVRQKIADAHVAAILEIEEKGF